MQDLKNNKKRNIIRDGNAEKLFFDWLRITKTHFKINGQKIALSRYKNDIIVFDNQPSKLKIV